MKIASLSEFENDGTKSLNEICKKEFRPLSWLVPGIIPLEGVTMIIGSPKAGKSLFVLNIVLSYMVEDVILDFYPPPTSPIKVLYLDLEASERRIKYRSLGIIGSKSIPANLIIATSWPRFGSGGLSKLKRRLDLEHFDLIIIDVLGKVQSTRKISNIHSYSLDEQEIDNYSKLCKQFQTSIILVHHTRKAPSADWVDMVSGSHGISGTVDTLLYLYREKGQTSATLHVTGRDVEEESFRLKFTKTSMRWEMLGRLEDVVSPLTEARQQVVDILNKNEGMMSPAEIAAKLDKSTSSIKMLLANLIVDGHIVRYGHGQYGKRIRI